MNTIYALGFFDGVHRGHQALLSRTRELAAKHGCLAGAVTFSVHPDTLIRGEDVPLISSDREYLLKTLGKLDTVVMLPFDEAMMHLSYRDFFRYMVDEHRAAGFVCGADFRFGYRGEGTPELLRELCAEMPCAVLPKLQEGGRDISSRRIRELLAQGQMEQANALLGYPHLLMGTVVPGRQLGRTIGIPTANLELSHNSLRRGVYACKAFIGEQAYLAVTNIGARPTVGGHTVRAEAWLLDFEGDLYGKSLRLQFYKYLRPEKTFPSLEELKQEIQENALQTRQFFEEASL